jgi:diguanylate cyclase (GGDEF)-like protein
MLVAMRHQLGHTLPAMLRKLPLRDSFGKQLGTALLFRPIEEVDALPHGESRDGLSLARSQAEIEDRLEAAFHEWKTNHVPFGLLWITVDQAAQMRRTHGRDACEAMLKIVEDRLAHGLRPTEVIGRWGTDEFLVLSHERTGEMLVEHGDQLTGLTRTADFRWWGDRVSLTASIGAAQAIEGDTLSRLMLEAQQAMHASVYAGGNHVTHGKGQACSR